MFRDCQFNEDIWDALLDEVLPDGEGCVAVLRAYVDASTRKDTGLLSVAAYLFESGRVRRFRQQWRDTFGTAEFSWAELANRADTFRDLQGRQNDAEHARLVTAGVSLVRQNIIAGCIASCWMQDVENFGPTYIKGFGHAYSLAGHMALAGIGSWAIRNNYRGGISYFIEAGDAGYDQLSHLLSYAPKVPAVVDMYQWRSHTAIEKTACSPFHAPDMFAWEWGKYWTETVVQKKRRIRRSLVNLLIDRFDSYKVMHLGGDPLLRFFKYIDDLGVEQLQEDRAAAASVQAENLNEIVQISEQTARAGGHE